MIKSIRLTNFKAFQDTGILELRPITVLAGPNSGGKSSILQSLLLFKQTLEGPPHIDLSLDGRFLQFSQFNEFTFGKPTLRRCHVSFEFAVESPIPRDAVPDHFPDITSEDLPDVVSMESLFRFGFRHKHRRDTKHRGDTERRGNTEKVVLNDFNIASKLGAVQGPHFKGKLVNGLYQTSLQGSGIRRPTTKRNNRINNIELRHFMPFVLNYEQGGNNDNDDYRVIDQIFLHPYHHFIDDIRDNLQYLGPLRERPRRAYLHSGNPLTEIGDSGQYAAQILWLERDNMVRYRSNLNAQPVEMKFLDAVNDAFLQLGMFQPLEIASERSIMYQIFVPVDSGQNSNAVTIADVGFGVSQLLPILVLGLRPAETPLLIFEQPEIHLHPKLQGNLADFFLTLSAQDRRIIVETHSDHFINRLRRRIAEDPTDELRNMVTILFVHPPKGGVGARIEPLRIDKFGIIENWPPDFLPEAADEAQAIFAAGLDKRIGDGNVSNNH